MEADSAAGGLDRVDSPPTYAVVIEAGEDSFGAYVPDLPGLFIVAESYEALLEQIPGAIACHLRELAKDGDPIPVPKTRVAMVPAANAA
jgi:predicted RNase H-like HicB family nuclease